MNKGLATKNNNKKVGGNKASAPNNIKSTTVGQGGGRKVTGTPGKADKSKNATASSQQVPNGKKKDTDIVMLTQAELDELMGTIGRLVMDSKSAMKLNDAAETREQNIVNNARSSAHEYIHNHNGVDNGRSAGVTWQDERAPRAVSFQDTSVGVAPVAASHMTLAERKRLEWNREADNVAGGWDPWSDRDTRVPPGHDAGRFGGYEPAPLQPGYSSYQQESQQRPVAPPSRPQPQFPIALTKAEKKRLQWEQERAEMRQLEGYNPWGRGGGGGGAPIKDSFGNNLTDYNARKETLESDRESARQQQLSHGPSSFSVDDIAVHRAQLASQALYKSQSEPARLVTDDSNAAVQLPPAAIRSSFAIGVPVPNENRYDQHKQRQNEQWRRDLEVQMQEQKKKKEEERRLWKEDPPQQTTNWAEKTSTLRSVPPGTLAPLSHQPRMDSFQSDPTPRDNIPGQQDTRLSSAPGQLNNSSRGFGDQTSGEVQTTFLRGQNVPIDAKTKQEMEEKRQKYLDNQNYLFEQMNENKRKKQEEKERQMKEDMDDEQRRVYELHQQQQQQLAALTQQLQQHQQPVAVTQSAAANGYNAVQNTQQFRVQQQPPAISKEEADRRRQEQLVKALEDAKQQAEKDKHERWLQRLIKGGHDVSKLKARFEEKLSPSHTATTQPVVNEFSKQPSMPTATGRPTGFTVEPDYVPGLELTSRAPLLPPIGYHGDGDEYVENRVMTPTVYRHRQQQQQQQQSQDFGASPKKRIWHTNVA